MGLSRLTCFFVLERFCAEVEVADRGKGVDAFLQAAMSSGVFYEA